MRCLFLSVAIIPAALTSGCHPFPQGVVIFGEPVIVEEYDKANEKCLATMVYGEARGESKQGQIAVAYTAVNRAVNRSVCDVILAPKQYSTFNDNPALKAAALNLHIEPKHKNPIDAAAWGKAVEVARMVMRKRVPDPTKGATHYLAPKAMEEFGYEYPEWSRQYRLITIIDNHQFYKYAPPKKEKKLVASI